MVIWSSQYTIYPSDLIKVRLRKWSSIKINKGCQGLMIFDLSMYKMSHPQRQMGTLGTLATQYMALESLTMASEGGRDKSKIRFICCPRHAWTLDSTLSNLTTSACVVLVARALISMFMKGPARQPSQSCKWMKGWKYSYSTQTFWKTSQSDSLGINWPLTTAWW